MEHKRRILFIGEASFIATGFGTYWQEVIKRLYETDKFEIAELGCIPNPYSMITMSDGSSKPISLINIGDYVVTHTGNHHRVINTFKKDYEGEVVEIQRDFIGINSLHTTANHQILVLQKKDVYVGGCHSFKKKLTPKWIRADQIQKGDFVAYTTINNLNKNKHEIKRHGFTIPLNSKFAFIAGWFLAEGFVNKEKKYGHRSIGICASLNEENLIKMFCDYIYDLFNIKVDYHKYESKGVYEATISNRKIASIFQSLFGSCSYDKFIDPDLFTSNPDFITRLLAAYVEGDGCVSRKRNVLSIKTVSKQLAMDIERLLLNNNIRSSVKKSRNGNYSHYLIEIAGEYANIIEQFMINKKHTFKTLRREETITYFNLLFCKVKYTYKKKYCGTVYNLEVECDDSYVCDDFVVHNSYASDDDPKIQSVPWKFYPVQPNPNDQRAQQIFRSKPTNQFGENRFDDVCIDFKPDIIAMIRDFWMDEFVLRSPFRRYVRTIWMPTIDGEPQKELWLDSYKQCDGILTYSEYGMNLLKKTGRPGTNLITIASPGADIDVFKPPTDKKEHKKQLGIDPESIIIGTVMRNQKRKLYRDLIEAFAMWAHKAKSKGHINLVRKTFLYLHTSYPDVGYDIGSAIKEFKVSNKVIMTYLCAKCGTAFPARFSGSTMNCIKCSQPTAHPPNASHQCPRHILADIMKCFDLYVQYSVCEGFGMPLAEAQSCGVPTMAVNYSAMEDHLQCPTSIPIDVGRFFYEAIIETEQKRALPNNQDFVNKLDRFVKLSDAQKQELNRKTREYIIEPVDTYGSNEKMPRRSWDRTAAIWHQVLTECKIHDNAQTWGRDVAQIYKPNLRAPKKQLTNGEFIKWVIGSIWNRPDMVGTFFAAEWLTALNLGFKTENGQRFDINRQKILDYFLNLIENVNRLEQRRVYSLDKINPDKIGVIAV